MRRSSGLRVLIRWLENARTCHDDRNGVIARLCCEIASSLTATLRSRLTAYPRNDKNGVIARGVIGCAAMFSEGFGRTTFRGGLDHEDNLLSAGRHSGNPPE